jgi:hypothetical protein
MTGLVPAIYTVARTDRTELWLSSPPTIALEF